MSTQKGNAVRSRPQKYQNNTVYKKDLYGTTATTKALDALRIEGLCPRCTHIIEWKIKFKKYKKLTAPGICVKCQGRTVKEAYHTICRPCATDASKCPKCCELHGSEKTKISSSHPAEKSQKTPVTSDQIPESKARSELKPDFSSPAVSADSDGSSDFYSGDDDSE